MKMDDQSYLRMKRKKLLIHLQDVADYIGISKNALSMFECYKMNLKKSNLQKYYEFIQLNDINNIQ